MAVARLHQHNPQLQNGNKTVEKVSYQHTHTNTNRPKEW